MKKTIYFDLDGVLRNLGKSIFGKHPESWGEKKDGKGFIEYVNDNPDYLIKAEPTKYLDVALEEFPRKILIMTVQLPKWIDYTEKWLDKYVGKDRYLVMYVPPDTKVDIMDEVKGLLVEDHPNLSSYEKIILIDRPYNRNVKLPMFRVDTKERLRNVIRMYRQW